LKDAKAAAAEQVAALREQVKEAKAERDATRAQAEQDYADSTWRRASHY